MANTSASGGYLVPTSADPVSDLDLDTVFQGLVSGVTGLPGEMVRQRVQIDDGLGRASARIPAQDVNWCAIGVTLEDPDFDPGVIHDGAGEGQDVLTRAITVEALASFYGPASGRNAGRLVDGLWIPQNRERLFLQGIDFVDAGPIRWVPDLANSIPRRRADIPMTFRRHVGRTCPVLNLKSVAGAIRTESVDPTPFTVEP